MTVPAAYIITHIASGKLYVGSTGDFVARKGRHLSNLRNGIHENKNLQKAYDEDPDLRFEVYMAEDREEAYDFEQFMLDQLYPSGILFNSHDQARGRIGVPVSEETRRKMSLGHMGRARSEETKQKIRATLSGRSNPLKGQKRLHSKSVAINGVIYAGILEASQKLGIPYVTISNRVRSETDTYKDWTWAT